MAITIHKAFWGEYVCLDILAAVRVSAEFGNGFGEGVVTLTFRTTEPVYRSFSVYSDHSEDWPCLEDQCHEMLPEEEQKQLIEAWLWGKMGDMIREWEQITLNPS